MQVSSTPIRHNNCKVELRKTVNLRPTEGKNEEFPFWAKSVVAQKGNMSAWEAQTPKSPKIESEPKL
jgi:hypothetical protein